MLGANAPEEVKDWQGMFDWCQRWTISGPEHADAWYHSRFAYYALDRYKEAIFYKKVATWGLHRP
jgi:hypothetical protein